MRRDAQRLQDIVDAADTAATYLLNLSQSEFFAGGISHDAILRQLTIIGEAVYKVSRGRKALHPEVPWDKIAGFRHRVVHDYFGLDLVAVWHIAAFAVPLLREQVIAILASEFPERADGPKE